MRYSFLRLPSLLFVGLASTALAQLPPLPHNIWTPSGAAVGAQSLGDVNGDGVPDFLIEEPSSTPSGFVGPSYVRIHSGATLAEIYGVPGSVGVFSLQARAVDDVDGNGLGDFSTVEGLYCGLSGGLITPASAFPQTAVPQLFRPSPIGDIDGQPGNEILVAHVDTATDSTTVYTCRVDGTALYQVTIPNSGNVIMERIEDLDFDGFDDFVVAVAENYLSGGGGGVFPPTLPNPVPTDTGWVGVFSGIDGTLLRSFQGGSGARLGGGMDVMPDMNGDGIADILVDAPHGPAFGTPNVYGGTGEVYLVCGLTLTMSLHWSCPYGCQSTSAPSLPNRHIRHVGDYDADGFPDFTVNHPAFSFFSGRTSELIGWHGSLLPTILGDLDGDGIVEVVAHWPNGGSYASVFSAKPQATERFGSSAGPWNWPESPQIGATSLINIGFNNFETGATVTVNASGIPPTSRALLLIGLSNTHWGPLPLPYDLTAAGVPGGQLLVSPDIVTRVQSQTIAGKTFLTRDFVVPPVMAGVEVFVQWLAVDPLGLAVSQGLKVTFE